MKAKIKPATLSDLPEILDLLNMYNMGDFGHSEREEMPKIEHFLVAREGRKLVGCAAFLHGAESKLTIHHRQAETGSLAVLPSHRGSGLGYRLQVARLQIMVGKGIETVFTETDTPSVIDWYVRKFGYKRLHTRRKTASFGNPEIDTFTLLELDLLAWENARQIDQALKDDLEIDIDWFAEQGFGNLAQIRPDTSQKLIINAAITGMVPQKSDSPHIPVSAEEIVADAERCYRAGASILHLHARDADGSPTYKADAYREFVPEIRRLCQDVIINITTSGRLHNTFECRSEVLNLTGAAKPDMASLTVGSNNFPKQASVNSPEMIQALARKMLEVGIKPELEVFETGMINYAIYLHRKGMVNGPFYFNFLLGSLGTIPARLTDLEHLISTLPPESTWGATGIGRFQLPINLAAIIRGGHVRVGLEDNLFYDANRQKLATNAMLIERLVKFAKQFGREVASSQETRRAIGLSS